MQPFVLNPTLANQNLISKLIAISASPTSRILNQWVGNFVINTSEVICLMDPRNTFNSS